MSWLKPMIVLWVTLSLLLCVAMVVGQQLETLTVVTYQQQDRSGQYAFFLKSTTRDLTVNISDHPCLVNLNGLSRQTLVSGEWAAHITFATDHRIIFMTDVMTGITCSLSVR